MKHKSIRILKTPWPALPDCGIAITPASHPPGIGLVQPEELARQLKKGGAMNEIFFDGSDETLGDDETFGDDEVKARDVGRD